MIGCFCGWILEVFWRRFFSTPRVWKNPGFLNGPYLPLYGFGTMLLYLISEIPIHFAIKVVLFCVVMTLIELIAGVVFIQGMKIKLWDYSKLWGNWKGIICPLYSFLWTVLGVAFYFLIYPHLTVIVEYTLQHYYTYLLIGFFYGVFAVDLAVSFNLSYKLKKLVDNSRVSLRYEEIKVALRERVKSDGKHASFLFPFKGGEINLIETIKDELEKVKKLRIEDEEEKQRLRQLKKNSKNTMK
ncbi:MAG: putative ABC transporter permease [Clostridia bacterium]